MTIDEFLVELTEHAKTVKFHFDPFFYTVGIRDCHGDCPLLSVAKARIKREADGRPVYSHPELCNSFADEWGMSMLCLPKESCRLIMEASDFPNRHGIAGEIRKKIVAAVGLEVLSNV